MRVIRGFITVIGLIGILVIVALLMGYYLFSLSPQIKTKMIPVAVTAEAAQNFDQKLEAVETQIDEAVAARENREVTLAISEKEVNSKLIELLAEGELPLNEVLVNFHEGYFLAYAVMDVPGVAAKTGAQGRIHIVDGEVKIVIDDFDLGKLPLPEAANNGVEELLNVMVRLRLADLPLEITDIELSNHELMAAGLVKAGD